MSAFGIQLCLITMLVHQSSGSLHAEVRPSGTGLGKVACQFSATASGGLLLNTSRELCTGPHVSITQPFTVSFQGTISVPSRPQPNITIQLRIATSGFVRVWIQDWPMIDTISPLSSTASMPQDIDGGNWALSWQNVTLEDGRPYTVRIEYVHVAGREAFLSWYSCLFL